MFGMNIGLGDIFAEERQEDSQQFNSAEAAVTRSWQEHMDNTAIQRRHADMRAAGINPLLSVHPGGVHGTPSGATASSGIAGSGGSTSVNIGPATAAQINVAEAQADKFRAEAEEARERTKNYDPSRRLTESQIPRTEAETENLKQLTGESAARIEKIWAEVTNLGASAANLSQQTENLKEAIPQIRANISHLRALADQSSAATSEIKQRVRQNLPELERILMNLERIKEEMAQPGHANAERAQDSFIGQLGAYLKALGGLPGAVVLKGRSNTTIQRNSGNISTHKTTLERRQK